MSLLLLPRRLGTSAGRQTCFVNTPTLALGRHRSQRAAALVLQQQQQQQQQQQTRLKTSAAAASTLAARTARGGGGERGGGKGGARGGGLLPALPQQQHLQRAFSAAAAGGGKTNPIKAKITGSLLDARVQGLRIEVGMDVELPHTFGPADVQTFAALSGDDNPIHLDSDYASKQGMFTGAIVHGLLVGSLFGTIFGVTFPGCVYLQQGFKFSRPVYVGKPVTALVEVTRRREREESSPPSTILFCSTHVYDDEGFCAVAGEAVVMLPFIQQGKDTEEEETKREVV